jgi:hypothetical protein
VNPSSTSEPGVRNKIAETIALMLIGVVALVLVAVPANVFLGRLYSRDLKTPETVQGGIELIVVFIVLALAAMVPISRRFGTAGIIFAAALYLQVHSILLPAVAGWLLLECLMLIGGAVQRLLRVGEWRDSRIRACLARFVVGVASWTTGVLILSAFGLGTIPQLRFYTMLLTVISLVAAPGTLFGVILIRRFEQLSSRDRVLVAFLVVLVLTQFGKTNYDTDFDSTWYGLRPERILIGAHSLFDNLKLLHFVYYYPKQFEVLTLPLANLNQGTFIVAFNVVTLAVSLLAVFQIARSLDLGRTGALLVTSLAGSIPAVANMGSTAKSDTLLSVYAFIAVVFLWEWGRERRKPDLAYGLSALLGMLATKITAYAYAPLLAFGFLVIGSWLHRKREQPSWSLDGKTRK